MTIKELIYLEDKYASLKYDLELSYKNCPIGNNETDFNECEEWFEENKVLTELIDFIEDFIKFAGYHFKEYDNKNKKFMLFKNL